MSSRMGESGNDIKVWGAVNNDAMHGLLLNSNIRVVLNGNNPPTVQTGTKFYVYKTDTWLSPLSPATGNNVYPVNTNLTYLMSDAIFEQSDRTFAWNAGLFPALANSTTYYLYCTGSEDTDTTSRGKGVYGASTNAPTYDYHKCGWYSADGLVLAMFKTSGAGAVLTTASDFMILDQQNKGYLIVNETQAANTQGGTFTSGGDRTRVINKTVFSSIYGSSLTSNRFTLPAGKYFIGANAPGYNVLNHQAWLYNYTDSAAVADCTGSSADCNTSATTVSIIDGYFSITSAKEFEIRHRCTSTVATFGLGLASNLGNNEIYTQVKIIKVA